MSQQSEKDKTGSPPKAYPPARRAKSLPKELTEEKRAMGHKIRRARKEGLLDKKRRQAMYLFLAGMDREQIAIFLGVEPSEVDGFLNSKDPQFRKRLEVEKILMAAGHWERAKAFDNALKEQERIKRSNAYQLTVMKSIEVDKALKLLEGVDQVIGLTPLPIAGIPQERLAALVAPPRPREEHPELAGPPGSGVLGTWLKDKGHRAAGTNS